MISDEQANKFVKALHEKTQRDQEPKTIVLSRQSNGLQRGVFTDLFHEQCHILESGHTQEKAIWLGRPGASMHLSCQMVAALLPLLTEFVESGELTNVNKGFFCSHCCESFAVSPEHPVKFCAICGDEFDVVMSDKEEPVLSERHSCPACAGEFGIYDSVEYRQLMGSLFCPYCGHDFFEAGE